jgi:hypothetical protein
MDPKNKLVEDELAKLKEAIEKEMGQSVVIMRTTIKQKRRSKEEKKVKL